jgi:hypothetical protein
MNELIELTREEKLENGSGMLLNPFIINPIQFLISVKEGFIDGIRDALKKS